MANGILSSHFSMQYTDIAGYAQHVGQQVDALLEEGKTQELNRLLHLIYTDALFPEFLSQHPRLKDYIKEAKVLDLTEDSVTLPHQAFQRTFQSDMEWPSLDTTDDDIDCSSFTSGDLPEASTGKPSSFAHEHLDVQSYTAAIIKHVAPFLETENTAALAAFVPHLQNDPLFPDLIREEPFLLPYLSKIEDPSLVLSATSNYIAFLKKMDPSFSPKDLATFFASFYTKIAKLYPPTAEITMLAFRAIEECGYHTDSSQNPIFTAIMESFENASKQLCQPQISKCVVRYLPNVFVLLPPSLQDNKDLILHVLPQNPFLYFCLITT